MTLAQPNADEEQRLPRSILAATVLGLGAVSGVSAMAGYAIAPGSVKLEVAAVSVAVMGLVILPYFILRETVLESRRQPSRVTTQVVHMFAALLWIVAATLAWFNRAEIVQPAEVMHLGVLALSMLPFVYLYIRLSISAKRIADGHRIFPRRVLIPAMFACVLPFMFGWTVASTGKLSYVALIAACVLIIWDFFSHIDNLRMHLQALLGLLFVSVVFSYFFGPEFRALTFGCLMTLAMGAAEVAKRVHLTASGAIPAHPNEDAEFYLKGANWSLVVFPLGLLLLLPFLVGDFPTWAACAASFVQIFSWALLPARRKKSGQAYWASVGAGFLVPVLVVVGTKLNSEQSILKVELLSTVAVVIGVVTAGIAAVIKQDIFKDFLSSLVRQDTFLSERNCRNFALFCVFICGVVVFIVGDVMAKIAQAPVYSYKASDIELFLFIVAILLFVFHPGSREPPALESSPERGARSVGSDEANFFKALKSFEATAGPILKTARWELSLVAGVPVAIALGMRGYEFLYLISISSCMVLSAMAAFLLNDYYDLEKDRAAGVQRPVCLGALPPQVALRWGIAAVGASMSLAGMSYQLGIFVIALLTNVAVVSYSHFSRRYPLLKGGLTAAVTCAPLVLALEALGHSRFDPVVVPVFVFIWGRELVMDAMDLPGDLKAGLKTLASVFGARSSKLIGWLVMFGAVLLLIYLSNGIGRVASIICLALLIFAFVLFKRSEDRGIGLSRLAVVVGSVAVALNVSI